MPDAATPPSPAHRTVPRGPSGGFVAVVVKGYPRLSETFIAQEFLGLEQRGLALQIWSLRAPYDPATHPIHDEIAAPVAYLPEYLWRAPGRVLAGWWRARRLPGYRAARAAFLRDLRRDRTPNRIRRFGQALVLAAELSPGAALLYAHFLHTPASVTRYAATMRGLPFAVSAHAKDIWTTPDWEKREKLADAAWLATCTGTGADHLRALAPAPDRVHCHHHGLDFARFTAPPMADEAPRDGSGPDRPVRIASVGRLVAKKGYDDLLDALARLPAGLYWRLDHIGGGPLAGELKARAERLGIAGRIDWRGRRPQADVQALLAEADLFVLASKIAEDGDRDGLPNVLMEAQAMRVACLSTAVSAIPELIEDGRTGMLVPPGDPDALAAALAALIGDPARRADLAGAGLARLHAEFDMSAGIDAIAGLLTATAKRGDPAHVSGLPPA